MLVNPTTSLLDDMRRRAALVASRSTTLSISSATFTAVPCPTVESDVGANYNTSTGIYTVRYTGLYSLRGTIRPDDATALGLNFLCSIHTSNGESVGEAWEVTVDNTQNANDRNVAVMATLKKFTAGDQVRLVTFTDKTGGFTLSSASLSISLDCLA